MERKSKFEILLFGHTSTGLPIEAWRWAAKREGAGELLVLGGVHGDEVEGVVCARGIMSRFWDGTPWDAGLTIVPAMNLDGVIARTRVNARGVDLNRNLPTQDWNPKKFNERYPPGPSACSEPENQALVAWLKEVPPKFIVSLHSFSKFLMNVNGDCVNEAQAMEKINRYPIEPTMGYPTPGCLGTYAGIERKMPTLTYEIERGLEPKQVLLTHVDAVIAGLNVAASRNP